jgi:hypothetical protein
MAVDRALRWYQQEVPAARSPPLTAEQAQALRAGFDGGRLFDAEMFDWALTFGRSIFRLARLSPDVPECNVGDVLTALMALPSPDRAWPVDSAVDAETYAKLEFREVSAGIVSTQRENREGWWAHAQRNRAFIEEAAALPTYKRLAVVAGGAHGFDLPLLALAKAYERLVLIDIDAESMEATVRGVFKDPGLRAKVETRVMDLTGINTGMVRALDAILDGGGSADEVQARLETFCRSYRVATPNRVVREGERPDLMVSSCVLSQVAWPQRTYALKVFEKRFRPVRDAAEQRWVQAWFQLEMCVQQDHLNALLDVSDVTVVTSDMASQVTALDQSGSERVTGHKIYTMGVDSLRERTPRLSEVQRDASWEWSRYRAAPRGVKGSRMAVEGVVLREPAPRGGLWVPESF